jgi:ABC-type transport system involved in multi-copper enzyme maturation permease subunit
VRREIERRTLDVILARPVSRLEYLMGKCLGLVATLAVLIVAMTVILALTLQLTGFGWQPRYLIAIGATGLELLVMASLAVLFSTVTSPTLAALFTLGLFAAGHLAEDGAALVGQRVARQRPCASRSS